MWIIMNIWFLHLNQNFITTASVTVWHNLSNRRNRWPNHLRFPFFQALLLLGIFVNLEMLSTLRRAPPDGSRFIGYQCTNKSCTRIFATHNALVRHKAHKAQKRTPCADMEKAVKVYSVDDNRASSLQPSRIVEFPLSGTMITHNTHNTHDTTQNPWAYFRRKFGVNRIFRAFFAIFGPNFRRIYAQKRQIRIFWSFYAKRRGGQL